jgi:transcriptional regulator with XRE-family HTH domain
MGKVISELKQARIAADLSQEALAERSNVSRMTVSRLESGKFDPSLATLEVIAKSLGMEIMLVPTALRPDLEEFVRSGGRYLGQPPGVGAPLSLVDQLIGLGSSAKGKP